MSELTVVAAGVRALLSFAESRGADRRVLLERSGIDSAELHNRDNRVTLGKYVALMKAAQELCRDPAFALHFGEYIDPSEVSFVQQIGAASMREAFATINRYARLTVEVDAGGADRYVMKQEGGQLWIMDTRKNPNDFPQMTESSFAGIICSMRKLMDVERLVRAVHVTHAAPSYRAEYERIFRVPVIFSSDRNAFLLDNSALTLRPPSSPKYASEVLKARAEELLQKLESSKSMRARVERLLEPALKSGDVSMESIASALNVSRQTLFRKLKAEDVTFVKVLDELRHRMALHYLNGGKMTVRQTAHLLGFTDPAAFSRAFKRWTGSRPSRYLKSS